MSNSKFFFLSSIIQVLFNIFTLPLFLKVLSPADLGYFILLQKLVSIGITLSVSTVGLILPSGILESNSKIEEKKYISSLLYSVILIGILFSIFFILLNNLGEIFFKDLSNKSANLWVFLSIPIAGVVLYFQDVLTIKGEAKKYFILSLVMCLINFFVMIFYLFIRVEPSMSLSISYFVSNLVTMILGFYFLFDSMAFSYSRKAFMDIKKVFLMSNVSDFLESAKQFLDNYILAILTNLHSVGLVDHALKYNKGAKLVQKSLNRSIWPIAIRESREGLEFKESRSMYMFGNLVILLSAIAFTFLSDEIVKYVGNNKFNDASMLASFSFLEILCYSINSLMMCLFFGRGLGKELSIATTYAMMTSLVMNVILIYFFKEYGVVLSGVLKIIFTTYFFLKFLNGRGNILSMVDFNIMYTLVYYIVFLILVSLIPEYKKLISIFFAVPIVLIMNIKFKKYLYQLLFKWRET